MGLGFYKLSQMAQAKIGKPDFFPMYQKIETVSIFFPINAVDHRMCLYEAHIEVFINGLNKAVYKCPKLAIRQKLLALNWAGAGKAGGQGQ